MALTGKTGYRLAGYTFVDGDIDKNANIETSKLATRTLYLTFPANVAMKSGAGCVASFIGVYGGVVMPDANASALYFSFRKPIEYVSGDIVCRILWSTAATAGNLRLVGTLKATEEGVTNTDSDTNTDAASGTTNLLNEITFTFSSIVTETGDFYGLVIERDPANVGDTIGADARIHAISFEFTGRG